jgi:hypothetical protein
VHALVQCAKNSFVLPILSRCIGTGEPKSNFSMMRKECAQLIIGKFLSIVGLDIANRLPELIFHESMKGLNYRCNLGFML